jgi:hypothetical protein
LSKKVAGVETATVKHLTTHQTKKTGIRESVLVIVAVVLMFSPTFIAGRLYHRLGADISILAIMALALFLVGTFLLLRFIKE